MTSGKKVAIAAVVLIALAGGGVAMRNARHTAITVQTAHVSHQEIESVVTASGEIKPRKYVNISANAMGRIRELAVKEGDRVSSGKLLGRLENTQPGADLEGQRAQVRAAEADSNAAEAGIKASTESVQQSQRTIERARADLKKAQLDFDRAESLFEQHLIAKQDFESKQQALDDAKSTLQEDTAKVSQAEAQVEQSRAQLASSQSKVIQANASLHRLTDILRDYDFYAPLDGIVTNLPVRVGETVVPGVQNSSASTVMTIADMSLITAEVMVDETDVPTVKVGQKAAVTIDAMPGKSFNGVVTEIGNTAIVRSTGAAASDSAVSGQEAKDFKVTIALDSPPEDVRPGLSATVRITTATRHNVIAVPLQALTVTQSAASPGQPAQRTTGVFVVSQGKADFHTVTTGISGAMDVEVVEGLSENEEIVVGPYATIRALRGGTEIKVDNQTTTPPKV
jgi:HlyD family secretion protein